MGVGTYSDNFGGTGSTFIVDAILDREAGLEQSNAQRVADGDEPLSASDHDEMCSFEEWSDLKDALLEAGASVGLTPDREAWANDFMLLCSDAYFSLGVRSWEIDEIVGVWQDDQYRVNDEGDYYEASEITSESMLAPERMQEIRDQMAQALIEIARIFVQESGRGCSFKTSGYTSSSYPLMEDRAARLTDLQAIYTKGRDLLSRSPAQALREEGVENYQAVMGTLCAEYGHDITSVGYLRQGEDGVLWARPNASLEITEFIGQGGICASELGLEHGEASLTPLPETPAVMQACIDRTAKFLERFDRLKFDVPPSFWVKTLGAGNDEIVLAASIDWDDEEPEFRPDGPGY